MATDRPGPHPMFAVTWIFWYVALCYGFFFINSVAGALGALGALLYFFVPEVLALRTKWRWTLSATMTWTVQKLSKHKIPFRGWNMLLVPAATIPSIVMLRIGVVLGGEYLGVYGAWWGFTFAAAFAIPSAVLCHQHWLNPAREG